MPQSVRWRQQYERMPEKLDPDQVAGVARKKAQAWVARRPWLTERERAHAFLEFADCFYQITLDFIAAQAREAGGMKSAQGGRSTWKTLYQLPTC